MSYGLQESASFVMDVPKLMVEIFGYSPSMRPAFKEQMTWEDWKAMIRQDIDEGLPILYDGRSDGSGHAFICDGYADDYFHFNWGWGGYANGYYVLSALRPGNADYSYEQRAVFQIKPTQEGSLLSPTVTVLEAKYRVEDNAIRNDFKIGYTGVEENDYYIGMGVVDSQNQIVQTPTRGSSIKVRFACFFYCNGDFRFVPSQPLQADERVVMFGSLDGTNWEVLPVGPNAEAGYRVDGPIPPVGEEIKDPVSPVNMSVYYNSFETGNYFEVDDLDNTIPHRLNVGGIEYDLGEPQDITLTYTIADYDQWKGKLVVYSGSDWSLREANAGERLTIDSEGRITYQVDGTTGDTFNSYRHYLKFLSCERGTLTFTLTATQEGVSLPAYTSAPMTIRFVSPSTTAWEEWSVEGQVGERIALKPQLSELDPIFAEERIYASVSVSGFKTEEYNLYLSNGEPIPMRESAGDPYFTFSEAQVPLWQGEQMIDYLLFEPKQIAAEGKNPIIYLTPYHNNHQLPGTHYACGLKIKATDTATADTEQTGTAVYGVNGAIQIHVDHPTEMTIHTLLGQQAYKSPVSPGDYRIPLPGGIYLVQIGEQIYKVKL